MCIYRCLNSLFSTSTCVLLITLWCLFSTTNLFAQIADGYSTYFGGSGIEAMGGVATTADGTSFYFGTSASTDYPTTSGAMQRYSAGGTDAVLTAIDKNGQVKWSTYIGQTGEEADALGIAVTPDDRFIYFAFSTRASSFPGYIGPQSAQATSGGGVETVVIKLRRNGAPVWGTFLGGSGIDRPRSVSATADGGVLITGLTTSADFPVLQAPDPTYAGNTDGFITHLSGSGILLTSTYVGGSGQDVVHDAELSPDGTLAAVGISNTPGWLGSPSQPYGGGTDVFIVAARSAQLIFSSWIGGSGDEGLLTPPRLAIDQQSSYFVSGSTNSSDFPTLNAVQSALAGSNDGFISAFDAAGQPSWSTYLGGTQDDGISSIQSYNGLLWVGGHTSSSNLAFITSGARQTVFGGGSDNLLLTMRATGSIAYASYYGGPGEERLRDLTTAKNFVSWVGSATDNSMLTDNAVQPAFAGAEDGHFTSIRLAEVSALIAASTDASSCTSTDAGIAVEALSTADGVAPYDLSFDAGATWPLACAALRPNSSDQLVFDQLQWGSYVVHVRDALGQVSDAGQLQLGGCRVDICTATTSATFEVPAIQGASAYDWTTTLGTISSGQGTPSISINTDGISGGTLGQVCLQPTGPSCQAPQLCLEVVVRCPEICTDTIDNDGDGVIDCEDEDCPAAMPVGRVWRL